MEMDWKSLITILWVFTGSVLTALEITDRKKDRIIEKLNENLKLEKEKIEIEKEKTKNSEHRRSNLEAEIKDIRGRNVLEMDRLRADFKLKEDTFKIKIDNEIENSKKKEKIYEEKIKQLENIIKENEKNGVNNEKEMLKKIKTDAGIAK